MKAVTKGIASVKGVTKGIALVKGKRSNKGNSISKRSK